MRYAKCMVFAVLAAASTGVLGQDFSRLFPDLQALEQGNRWVSQGAHDRAVESYLTAAEYGNANAMRKLGEMYRDGAGVDADQAQALAWLTLAGEYGNTSAAGIANLLEKELEAEAVAKAEAIHEDLLDDYGRDAAHSKRKKWARRELRGSSGRRAHRKDRTQIQIEGRFFTIELGDLMDALDAYTDELKG